MSYNPTAADEQRSGRSQPEPTGWVGWIAFAAAMLTLLGAFHAIAGLTALFKDDYFLVHKSGLVVSVDYTTWGWVHLILGIVVLMAGFALFAGKLWARIVAVIVALFSAILNLAFTSAYPLWSAIMIAVDILVIYAVTAHGREVRDI